MGTLTIGITGGSGSGKTTVSRKIIESVGSQNIVYIEQDSYYKDLSHLSIEERAKNNFDHPASMDLDLMLKHIKQLKSGKKIEKPLYDYTIHSRKKETIIVEPKKVIIVEGILIMEPKELRDLLDVKIFVEAPSDIRFTRRLLRDLQERGRSAESVVEQYLTTVRPMYKAFVSPTKEYADVIIPWQGYNDVAIDVVLAKVRSKLI